MRDKRTLDKATVLPASNADSQAMIATRIRTRITALWLAVLGSSLVRNSLYLMGATVVTSALGYVFWVVAARLYPARSIGLSSALISATMLTSAVSILGLNSTLIALLPKRESDQAWSRTFNSALLAGVSTGLLAGATLLVVLPRFSASFRIVQDQPWVGLLVLVCVPAWTFGNLLDFTFIAERAARFMFTRNSIFAAIKLPLLVGSTLLLSSATLGILSSWTLALTLSVLLGCVSVRRLGHVYHPTFGGVWDEMRSMVTLTAGNHLANVGSNLPTYLMPLLVTARLSPTDNAYFYTTWMIGGLFFMVSTAVSSSLFAEGSHAVERLRHNLVQSTKVILLILIPIVAVYVIGGHLILGLFGREYAINGFGLLMVLTVSAIPDGITNLYVSSMRVLGHLRYCVSLNCMMAAITLVSAWFLLPAFGLIGAGLAWLLGQTVGSIVVGIHLGYFALRSKQVKAVA